MLRSGELVGHSKAQFKVAELSNLTEALEEESYCVGLAGGDFFNGSSAQTAQDLGPTEWLKKQKAVANKLLNGTRDVVPDKNYAKKANSSKH